MTELYVAIGVVWRLVKESPTFFCIANWGRKRFKPGELWQRVLKSRVQQQSRRQRGGVCSRTVAAGADMGAACAAGDPSGTGLSGSLTHEVSLTAT